MMMNDKPKVWIWTQKAKGKRPKNYIVQWVCPDAKRVKSRSCGRDRTYAEAFKVDKIRDLAQGITTDVRGQSWESFKDDYLADARVHVDARDKAEGTYQEAAITLRLFTKICNPRRTIDINYVMVNRFKVARMDAGLSNATVNKNLAMLRGIFNKCVQMEIMAKNPLSNFRNLKFTRGVGRVCSDDEIKILLAACPDDRWLAFCLIGVRAGFRSGEVTHLEWADVDFENDMLHIRNKPDWRTKTSLERSVPMTAAIREVLVRLQSSPNRFKSSYVILNNRAKPFFSNLNAGFNRLIRKAGLIDKDDPIKPHALRRTFGTNLANNKTEVKTLMDLMGHSSYQTTLRYYVKSNVEEQRKAVAGLPA